MNEPSPPQHPIAAAMEWVARIMAAAVFMVAPVILARWLEGGPGLLTLIATMVGLACGLTYLIVITSSRRKDNTS